MSLHYTKDLENKIILVTGEGPLTIDDVRAHWRELFQDPAAMKLPRAFVDVRRADIQFTGPEVMELTRTLYVPKTRGRRFKLAMVVSGMVQFGVARQQQMVAEGEHNHRIFTDAEEAMEWLMLPGD